MGRGEPCVRPPPPKKERKIMISNTLKAKWSGWRFFAVCLLGATLTAGCGISVGTDGSGSASTAGVGTGGTGIFKASLSGSNSNGYLVNAVIFLDKNSNYQLDSGEPFAATDVNGTCSLAADPADVGRYPVVALAVKGVTVDSITWKPLTTNYVLSFPKESINSGENLISPLSTQLRELIETGKYSTTQQALDAMVSQMGLPVGTNLLDPSVVSANATVQITSQAIASLMSLQMDRIMSSNQALDVERYRAMMTLIENNMKIVARFNTPENMANLSNNITVVLETMPTTQIEKSQIEKSQIEKSLDGTVSGE